MFGGVGTEKLDPQFSILDLNDQANALNPAANVFSDNTGLSAVRRPVLQHPAAAIGPVGFVTPTFTPLALQGDYHIQGPPNPLDNTSWAPPPSTRRGAGRRPGPGPPGVQTITNLGNDIDGEIRPFDEPLVTDNPSAVDIGADEFRRIVLP